MAKKKPDAIERVERIEVDDPFRVPDLDALQEAALALEVDATAPRGLIFVWAKTVGGPLLAPLVVVRTDEDGFYRIVVCFGSGGRVLVGNAAAIEWFKKRIDWRTA